MTAIAKYQVLKWIGFFLLITHLFLRFLFPEPNVFIDLILFNLVGLIASAIAFNAPIISDKFSAISFPSASLIWSIGSFFSTWN